MRKVLAVLSAVVLAMAIGCGGDTPTTPRPPCSSAPVISQFSVDTNRLLSWTVTGEGSVVARIDPLIGNVQLVGQQLVSPDTYTIAAKNECGQVRRSVQVK